MTETKASSKAKELHKRLKSQLSRIDISNIEEPVQKGKRLKKEGFKPVKMPNIIKDYIRFNDPIVTEKRESLETVLGQIKERLQCMDFEGHFVNVGSFEDGTKVKFVNEFDCLFVWQVKDIEVRPSGDGVTKRIFVRDIELCADKERSRFADAIDKIVEGLELGDKLQHAGFASPKYSGVRINKPTCTLQFNWTEGKRYEHRMLTVDLTLALPGECMESYILPDIESKIKPIVENIKLGHPTLKLDLRNKLHFVAVEDDEWQLSSTALEAHLLKHLPDDGPIKRCIKIAKILNYQHVNETKYSKLQKCMKQCIANERNPKMYQQQKHLQETIDYYLQTNNTNSQKNRERKKIMAILRYGHIIMECDRSRDLNEHVKPASSLISAAIKHRTIFEACTNCASTAFSSDIPNVEFELLIRVFQALGEKDVTIVQNFFVDNEIKIVSVAPYAESDASNLTFNAKWTCQKLEQRLAATKRFNELPLIWAMRKITQIKLGRRKLLVLLMMFIMAALLMIFNDTFLQHLPER